MPRKSYAKKRKPRPTRRPAYRRRNAARPTTVVQRGITPIAPRTITRLRYTSVISRTLNAGIAADNVYRLNSIFDPDFTGTGTQPYGHDTYAQLYNRYRVFAASYRVTFNTTSVNAALFSVVPNNSTSSISDIELAREMPRSKSKVGGQQGTSPAVIYGRISMPALNGQNRTQYMSDDRFQAIFGNNPTEDLCLHIVSQSPDNITVRAVIDIVYHVEMFDPLPLAKS